MFENILIYLDFFFWRIYCFFFDFDKGYNCSIWNFLINFQFYLYFVNISN